MGFSHVVYIPVMLLIGLVSGYILGARVTRRQIEEDRKRAAK
jgi:uncharacterized protein YneF (UPF0154 family)